MKLTSEDGTPIESLDGIIPAGESSDMYFNWNVTEEQLKDGKISVDVEYSACDGPAGEDGKPTLQAHKIRCTRAIIRADGAAAAKTDPAGAADRFRTLCPGSSDQFRDLSVSSGLLPDVGTFAPEPADRAAALSADLLQF